MYDILEAVGDGWGSDFREAMMPVQDRSEPEDAEAEAAAVWLQDAGLAGPAYLFLHGLHPLAYLGGQSLLFLQPLLPPGRWRQKAGSLVGILGDRSRLESLLASLETHLRSHRRTQGKENA